MGSKLSHSLSRESSQRTAAEVEQQPAAPKTEPVSLRGVRPSEEEQGHSLGTRMICDIGDLRPGTPARVLAANVRSAPATWALPRNHVH